MDLHISNQADFDEAVRNYRGQFPVLLTTDGTTLSFAYGDGTGKSEGVAIDVINSGEMWPSFVEASRCLVLAERGWRGAEMKEQIDDIKANRQIPWNMPSR
jgi:hypothetical protein